MTMTRRLKSETTGMEKIYEIVDENGEVHDYVYEYPDGRVYTEAQFAAPEDHLITPQLLPPTQSFLYIPGYEWPNLPPTIASPILRWEMVGTAFVAGIAGGFISQVVR